MAAPMRSRVARVPTRPPGAHQMVLSDLISCANNLARKAASAVWLLQWLPRSGTGAAGESNDHRVYQFLGNRRTRSPASADEVKRWMAVTHSDAGAVRRSQDWRTGIEWAAVGPRGVIETG